MTRTAVLSDEIWARIEPVLPPVKGAMGRPMRAHRSLVEGAIYRYRTGVAWRDLPAEFGPWQTVWKRHHRFWIDGTLGQGLVRVAGPGRRGRTDRLAPQCRLDERAGAPAWCDRCEVVVDADVAYGGLGRMTKIRGFARTEGTNRAITLSGVRAAA